MSYLQLTKAFIKLLFPSLCKDRKTVSAFLASLLITGLDIAATAYMLSFFKYIKQFNPLASHKSLIYLTSIWLVCLFIVQIAKKLRKIIFFKVTNDAIRDIRESLLNHIHQVPLARWGRFRVSSILSSNKRIAHSIRGFMSIIFVKGFPDSCKLFILLISMICLHHAAIFFLLPMALAMLATYFTFRRFLSSRQKAWTTTDQVMLSMQENLYNTRKARLESDLTKTKVKKVLDQEAAIWWRANLDENNIFMVQGILFWVGTAMMVAYMVWGILNGQVSLVMLLLMKGYAFSIYKIITFLTRQTRKILTYMVDLKKIIDVFEVSTEKRGTASLCFGNRISKQTLISFKNVSFGFTSRQEEIIKNISFSIEQGEKVGIIGASGMGKSTLCHLVAGLYIPTKGKIMINGIATKHLQPATIGKHIHFVSQEAMIEAETIQAQIGSPLEAIKTSPLGYLHDRSKKAVGENGNAISSGEKQRILLARSLALNPKIVILDETLSAIDEKSAQSILQQILKKVPTVVLVSHRHSLMTALDKVYELKNGCLNAAMHFGKY
ncbi:MAG: ABC transporter ATP-binding protein [Bacteroidota bacterium]